ncbi:MAG: hypothetical protein IJA89_08895 [Clostridia bacterium]|nr:hypothetical protein [Clostridia bacterium]
MAKSKLKNVAIVAISSLLAVTTVALVVSLANDDEAPAPTETRVELEAKDSVNASMDGAKGDVRLVVDGNMPLAMGAAQTQLGGDELKSIVIEAANAGDAITVTGDVRTSIKLTNASATLTFKGLTFYDAYAGSKSYITDYIHFAGVIAFEDCTFTHGIRLKADANMTFDGCTFVSPSEDRYSVWVEDGKATFEDCTFKGYRGMKIHEDPKTVTDDITTVSVNECLFDELSVKCGVAIGTVNANTVVKLTNNQFIGCRSWDTVGSLEGVDGVYESDTPVKDYTLTLEGNEVRGTVSNIYYFAVIDGNIGDAFPLEFLTAEHPTTYVQEVGATIPVLAKKTNYNLILQDCWFTNEGCTERFAGTIPAGQTGDVYLYAMFEDDNNNWTQNY